MDKASKTRRLLFRLGTVLILIGICVVMMIIGRGHTVYFDNKKLDHEGITYDCPYKVKVLVKGEQVANLKAKERGMATTIGQDFEMTLKITQEKGGDEVEETYSLKLPYNLDGIVVNLPSPHIALSLKPQRLIRRWGFCGFKKSSHTKSSAYATMRPLDEQD